MALPPVRKTIQDLPENFFTQVIIFSASAPRCARVCKGWQKAIAERCYPLIVYNYRQDIKIGRFTQGDTTLPFEAVKQTYLAVMSKTDAPHIQSEMEGLDRSMPLALGPIVEIIENANLVRFFGRLSEQIPDDGRPKLKGDLAGRSAVIRDWMKNHRESFDQLPEIDLSRLNITILPQEIGRLIGLRSLILCNNRLTALPQEASKLTNLTSLDLEYNQLTALPQEIVQLTNLMSLNLSTNKLTIPEGMRLQFPNLLRLRLSNNYLTTVPEEIFRCTNLTGLDLSQNNLTTLPQGFSQLINLDRLKLRRIELINLQRHPLRNEVIANSYTLNKIVNFLRKRKTQEALKMFGELPSDIKNAIYEELYKLQFFPNHYDGCAEDAFMQRTEQGTRNTMRIKAIKNFLDK